MKLTKKQQEFIKDVHGRSDVCQDYKSQIKENFPKLFKEDEFKVGRWMFSSCKSCLAYVNELTDGGDFYGFGFVDGNWTGLSKCWTRQIELWKEATEEEIFEHLKTEAKKRGFVEGAFVDNNNLEGVNWAQDGKELYSSKCIYISHKDTLSVGQKWVYKKGKWAEILTKEMTQEEIERELGYKITIKCTH